ncbi:class I SAM-dependent methyltransferase [Acinetobacter boissieri]|uniref:Ribosomal RNA small subunit methyltransferase J n=1 Tax=Acinetobacter boissieri TaxID=1219383 RepID=A0A1G6J4B7_9GAMM|nr:class I SAM-dependent methyltransferase [Acinetobacter boissieri]SDC13638.1 16S rRNA (guanine1516-N2)-methyltransferase [Acinetobacter boissieri]
MRLTCWYTQQCVDQLNDLRVRLFTRGVEIDPQEVALINAKFLRLNPELALVLDIDGLSLSANGMKMQPDWNAEIGRLKRATLKTEMLARATQANDQPRLIDATAGLGHDSLLMAKFGAKVTLIERHPILFTLLEASYERAQIDPFLASVVANITLVFADAEDYLEQQYAKQQKIDVVYLDPMFPQRDQNQQRPKKQAQVKKQMQILHLLLPEDGEMDLGDALLLQAQKIAKRVIVKRPRHAVFLNNDTPQHQWLGDACRFDGYFCMNSTE